MKDWIYPRSLIEILIIVCLSLVSGPVRCEIVDLQLPSGIEATARLLEGEEDKQAVLILHGFLQTRDFFTVRRLGEALHDMGHTVLIPNLSLGIDNRRQSLACEAIHTHSMSGDINEISFWVDWLRRRTGKAVALLGHSAGSLDLVAYLANEPDPPVAQVILISLVAFEQGPIAKEDEAERKRALQLKKNGINELTHFRLAFCDSYTTTPENYLSYLQWNGNKTLKNLNNLAVKPTILLGGEDRRLGNDWLPSLKQAGIEVIEIPGANHFFDHEYEFDLMDKVQEILH
jgi:pimeloyl-ACP methyl ester carboxylesterase